MSGRINDWRTDLLRWAWTQPGLPFVWGETDCVTLARKALEICFGREVFPEAPIWHSAREAAEVFEQTGGLEPALKRLGAEESSLMFARTGDVICFPEPEEDVGGVAVGIWCDNCCLMSSAEGVILAHRIQLPPDARVWSLWSIPEPAHG